MALGMNEALLEIFDENEKERLRAVELRLETKMIRDASNPFMLNEEYFRKHYRFSPTVGLRLVDIIYDRLIGIRSTWIPPHLQVLVTLRFLADGALQKGFSECLHHPIGQSTSSRCINRVINAILELSDGFIQFPMDQERRQIIQNEFQETIRIPGVIGLMDCFLVSFKRPINFEEAFYNYKAGHAMNVQLIVDSQCQILNLRVYPGSNNDKFVWRHSEAKDVMEHLRTNHLYEMNYYLLADGGYDPSPVVLTPFLNAQEGTPASVYTQEHVRTRCKVEQTIGLLTNVWRAIKRCQKMSYSPQKVVSIIQACGILHNFRIRQGFPIENNGQNCEINHLDFNELNYHNGIAERFRLLRNYYV